MGRERDGSSVERRENEFEYIVLKFPNAVSTNLDFFDVNPRTKLSQPNEFRQSSQKQAKSPDDMHPFSIEYKSKFLERARSANGFFGLADAIDVLTEDGWEPMFTGKMENFDNFILFKRGK